MWPSTCVNNSPHCVSVLHLHVHVIYMYMCVYMYRVFHNDPMSWWRHCVLLCLNACAACVCQAATHVANDVSCSFLSFSHVILSCCVRACAICSRRLSTLWRHKSFQLTSPGLCACHWCALVTCTCKYVCLCVARCVTLLCRDVTALYGVVTSWCDDVAIMRRVNA